MDISGAKSISHEDEVEDDDDDDDDNDDDDDDDYDLLLIFGYKKMEAASLHGSFQSCLNLYRNIFRITILRNFYILCIIFIFMFLF